MLSVPKPVSFKSTVISSRSKIMFKDLAGFWKLSLVIKYDNGFPEFKFH